MLNSFRTQIRAAMLVVLMAAVFIVPQTVHANPNKAPGTACIGCHTATMEVDGTQEIFVAIDGVQTNTVTVAPGGSFEIDWVYEKLRGTSTTRGVASWIGGPTWTYGPTTVNAAVPTMGGHVWNANWDNLPGKNGGDAPAWVNNGADGDDVDPDVPPLVPVAYVVDATNGNFHEGTGSIKDDGSVYYDDATLKGYCDTQLPDSTYDAVANECSALASAATAIPTLCGPTWGGTYSTSGGGPSQRDVCAWPATGDPDGVADVNGADIRVTVPGGTADGTYFIYPAGVGRNAANTKGMVFQPITVTVSSGADVTPPSLVVDFAATSGQSAQVPLSWTNPADVDLAEVKVMRKVGSYPTDNADAGATQVYQNLTPVVSGAEALTDAVGPPVNGTTYYYAVFVKDSTGNWNDTVTGGSNANTATPNADVTPPALVADFTATSGQNAQVPLSWTNPVDVDLAEVLVIRKVGSYPTDHLDAGATQVYQDLAPTPSAAVAPTDTTGPPVNATTYYYAVFVKDSTGNWNETVTGGANANTATPSAGNANPDPPANLAQNYLAITPIALGGYTTEASVVFEADIADSTDTLDTVKLRIDTNTDGTFDCESTLGANPSTNVQVTCALADGSYDWQARTVDNLGAVSAWVPFNAASPDFIKDASAPVDGTLTATPGDTQVVLNWTAATDAHSGLTSPAYAVAKLAGAVPPADCSAPLTTTNLLTYTDNAVVNGSTYSYRICATNSAGLQSAGTTDSATPSAGCSYTDPSVTILTASKDITTDGGFTDYIVQVTNNDSAICANASYTLSVSDSNSTNFYTSVLAQTSLTNVAPGASAQTTFRVSALANQPNSVTNNSDVTTALDANHAAVTSVAITTTINVSGGGCVANGNYLNTNGDQLMSSRR